MTVTPDRRLKTDELTVLPLETFDCEVGLLGSKSYTNRYLALAALSGRETLIEGALLADDTLYLASAIAQFGHVTTEVDHEAAAIRVVPTGKPMTAPSEEIFMGGAGTPLRFLISLAAHASGTTVITGNARMQERPMGDLLAALPALGATAEAVRGNGSPPIRVTGPFRGGRTSISGQTSSQFTSSLIINAIRAEEDTEIVISDDLISRPYVEMTLGVLAEMGVETGRVGYESFSVRAGQEPRGGNVTVEPDASAMSYFLVAAAILGGRVTIPGIDASSRQGDVQLFRVLERMGCKAGADDGSITLSGGPLHGIDVDMEAMPDVVPTLAVAAAYATGVTRITNIASLRVKECDRIAAVTTELRKMGVTVEELPDALHIIGGTPHAAVIDTYDDHRMAMSFAIAGLRAPGTVIREPGCVAKSFPTFWSVLDTLHPTQKATA